MHITLWFDAPRPKSGAYVRLPRANLHLFQSLLYAVLPPERSAFLHDVGYLVGGRRMKLFAMSWPMASSLPTFEERAIRFPLPLRLVVSTPVTATLDGIAGGALSARELRIGNNKVVCARVSAEQQRATGERLMVRTLSPITCYTQVERRGRPFTLYYDPDDKDFAYSIHHNLVRKFRALHPDREPPEGIVRIDYVGDVHEKAARFREDMSFPIKGWMGRFLLEGPEELLQVALDCGLGAKNSSGWGCVVRAEG